MQDQVDGHTQLNDSSAGQRHNPLRWVSAREGLQARRCSVHNNGSPPLRRFPAFRVTRWVLLAATAAQGCLHDTWLEKLEYGIQMNQ